ncbi:MAG: hypothetical protein JW800_02535 [Candidatus Omnitrophica bacterium]|nr:hypothetical protein [Candidatus Omnitrophota bacterium]
MKKNYKRSRFLVNKRFQYQFSFFLALQAAIPIFLFGMSLYIINKLYLTSIQIVIGNDVLPDYHIKEVLNFSAYSVLALLVISSIILFYFGIRFSHHIAGPLYKLEQTIERLAKGQKAELLRFRKTDLVNGLADNFNFLIEELNKTRK